MILQTPLGIGTTPSSLRLVWIAELSTILVEEFSVAHRVPVRGASNGPNHKSDSSASL